MNSNFSLSHSLHFFCAFHCPFVRTRARSFFRVQFPIYVIMCFIVYQKGAGIKLSKYTLQTENMNPRFLPHPSFALASLLLFSSFKFSFFFFKYNQFEISTHSAWFSLDPKKFIAFACDLRCRDYNNFSWVCYAMLFTGVCVCLCFVNVTLFVMLTKDSLQAISMTMSCTFILFETIPFSPLPPVPACSHPLIIELFVFFYTCKFIVNAMT